MKKFAVICAVCVAVAPLAVFAADTLHGRMAAHRDWDRQAALAANDLPAFLHYNPTDGDSYSGKVRKSMDPTNVQP